MYGLLYLLSGMILLYPGLARATHAGPEHTGPLPKRILLLSAPAAQGEGLPSVWAMARILADLEVSTGEPTHKRFEMIIGNGAGSILAMHLAQGKPAAGFLPVRERPPLWKRALWWESAGHRCAKVGYPLLGHATMGSLVVPAAVIARDVPSHPHVAPNAWMVMSKEHPQLGLLQAVQATSGTRVKVRLDGIVRRLGGEMEDQTQAALFSYLSATQYFPGTPIKMVHIKTQAPPLFNSYAHLLQRHLRTVAVAEISLRVRAEHRPASGASDAVLQRAFVAAQHAQAALPVQDLEALLQGPA